MRLTALLGLTSKKPPPFGPFAHGSGAPTRWAPRGDVANRLVLALHSWAMTALNATRLREFRRAVQARIEEDLRRESVAAARLREEVVPAVCAAVAAARAAGEADEVWLFGSFAWGTPREGSDVDLLAEEPVDVAALADRVQQATGRLVHVVTRRSARADLCERIDREGINL